jgi:hypothetical protein
MRDTYYDSECKEGSNDYLRFKRDQAEASPKTNCCNFLALVRNFSSH